jgi:hypothetical protein
MQREAATPAAAGGLSRPRVVIEVPPRPKGSRRAAAVRAGCAAVRAGEAEELRVEEKSVRRRLAFHNIACDVDARATSGAARADDAPPLPPQQRSLAVVEVPRARGQRAALTVHRRATPLALLLHHMRATSPPSPSSSPPPPAARADVAIVFLAWTRAHARELARDHTLAPPPARARAGSPPPPRGVRAWTCDACGFTCADPAAFARDCRGHVEGTFCGDCVSDMSDEGEEEGADAAKWCGVDEFIKASGGGRHRRRGW